MTTQRTMFEKIWDAHVVAEGPGDQTLLFIDRHLLHDGSTHAFEIDPFRKQGLLTGQDEIALTLTHESAIVAFEARRRRDAPWLAALDV